MMPSRIIREGILTSEAVNSLSDQAELFYRRLMSVVDDYGRYYSHPGILRAACYPLKVDSVTENDVQRMVNECSEAGLIGLYGGKFLQVARFGQQIRSKSKYPEPVEADLLSKCEANAKRLSADPAGTRNTKYDFEIRNTTPTAETRAHAKPTEPTAEQLRLGALFSRRPGTQWMPKEIKAWKAITPIPEEDFALIERYYLAEIPKDRNYRRRELQTLLNNWNGELDRARKFDPANPGGAPKQFSEMSAHEKRKAVMLK
jgi:hypothetical protein